MTDEHTPSSDTDAPRVVRPRHALAAPGRLDAAALERHARRLRGEPLPPETPEEAAARADLSELLDRLGSPDLTRLATPLAGTLGRLLPSGASPERAEAARRRQAEQAERRRAERAAGRRRAAEAAARRAEETARREAEAAERARAARTAEEAQLEAERAAEAERAEQERHREERLRERREESVAARQERARRIAEAQELARQAELRAAAEEAAAHDREVAAAQAALEAELRARQERAEEEDRRRRAALLARRRRQEQRRHRRQEAERARREAAEEKERAARQERERREAARARREREAAVAAERARVQAERRAREQAEAAERERLRAAAEAEAEAERRRLAQEAAEAERRRRAEEAERARREAERLRREAEEARRRWVAAERVRPARLAERNIAVAAAVEDRRRAAAARAAEEEARRLREHQARETRALMAAARELDGPEMVPAPQDRPLLSSPDEGVDDAELLARARAVLPEWRRRERLRRKAAAVQATSSGSRAASGGAGGGLPLIPGYAPPTGDPEPARPATRRDRGRQLGLTAAYLVFVLASAWGMGVLRLVPGLDVLDLGSYRAAHDGRYAYTSSVLSLYPLHPLVWPGLWAALGVYVLHQWGRGQGAATRQRDTRGPVAGALLLVAAWFPLAILVPWGLEFVVWLAALALMLRVVRLLAAVPARTRAARICTDGTLGLLFGLLLTAAPTTLASPVVAAGLHLDWFPTTLLAWLLLVVVLLVGARVALQDRGRLGVALGMSWTLLCLALPRLLPSPVGAHQSTAVGLTAVFGGLGLLLLVVVRRAWVREVEQEAGATGFAHAAPTADGDDRPDAVSAG